VEIFWKLLPEIKIDEANIKSPACMRIFSRGWEHHLWFICSQGTYLVPSIDRFWMQQQEDVLSEFQDKDFVMIDICTFNLDILTMVFLA
jgi:hypothetical protein